MARKVKNIGFSEKRAFLFNILRDNFQSGLLRTCNVILLIRNYNIIILSLFSQIRSFKTEKMQ